MICNKPIKFGLALLTILLATLFADRAWAANPSSASSAWADADFAKVRLVAAVNATGEAGSLPLGLHFVLKDGWKVYWRSPGDAGFPPRIDWSGSQNLASAAISWPIPKRFSILGFETLGYKHEVVLPINAVLKKAAEPLTLRASVDYLACSEICIPIQADLSLDMASGAATTSAFAHLVNRYSVLVPGDGSAHGMAIKSAKVITNAKNTILQVKATTKIPFGTADMYVEGPEELQFSPPRISLSDAGHSAVFETSVNGVEDIKGGLVGKNLTITIVDGVRSAEVPITPSAAPPEDMPLMAVADTGAQTQGSSLAWILAMALIGGFILNLMPCVLPVLSIKVLGVISHGGGERHTVRLSFIASAAGILFSFVLMAGILVLLKQAGYSVGWGIQFQHPAFLIAMTLVVALFAYNLWGFFEIKMPLWIGDLGEHSSHVHGLGGSFLSGVLATLLATPCSAPFLGTAVGFALSRGIVEIFTIFTALGIGLALPFLILAAAPGLVTKLPRPGPWMEKLKRILGFALAATAIWLLSVLTTQVGFSAMITIAALLLAMGVVLYLHRGLNRTGLSALIVLSALAFIVPQNGNTSTPPPTTEGMGRLDKLWVPFDKAAIADLIVTGKVVFVDVTADWCITCIVNKTFVLAKGEAFSRLSAANVVAMKADWTQPDEAIARYLASFKRYGIPFNAVYGPGAPKGIVLSELLTEDEVVSAMDKATKIALTQ